MVDGRVGGGTRVIESFIWWPWYMSRCKEANGFVAKRIAHLCAEYNGIIFGTGFIQTFMGDETVRFVRILHPQDVYLQQDIEYENNNSRKP